MDVIKFNILLSVRKLIQHVDVVGSMSSYQLFNLFNDVFVVLILPSILVFMIWVESVVVSMSVVVSVPMAMAMIMTMTTVVYSLMFSHNMHLIFKVSNFLVIDAFSDCCQHFIHFVFQQGSDLTHFLHMLISISKNVDMILVIST